MSRVTIEGNHWVLEGEDGGRAFLWDVADIFANHSAVGLLGMIDEQGTCRLEDSFTVRLYQNLSALGSGSEGTARQAAILLALKEMLAKYRPYRFLGVGMSAESTPARVLRENMRAFHAANRLFCVTEPGAGSTAEGDTASWQMAYEDLLLPAQSFDVAIVDDTMGGRALPIEAWPKVIACLRAAGRLLVISPRAEWAAFFRDTLGSGDVFPVEGALCLYSAAVTPEGAQRAREATVEWEIGRLKAYLRQTVGKLAAVTEAGEGPEEVHSYIALTVEMEEIALTIYGELRSVDIKYRLSRFKEALINYSLHIGSWDKVQTAYQELRAEIQREN